jgi:hypothetical protein
VKEDDTDHEKRRASAEKQKSVKDAERKKEKKKNLERQALEKRRAKSRRGGCLRGTPLTRTMRTMMKMTVMILRGWQLALTGSCRTCREPTLPRHVREPPRGHKVSFVTGTRRRRPPAAHAPTLLLLPSWGNPFQRPAWDTWS